MKKKMIDLTNDNDDENDDNSSAKVLCILSLLVLVAVHTALRGKEGKICISTFFGKQYCIAVPASQLE